MELPMLLNRLCLDRMKPKKCQECFVQIGADAQPTDGRRHSMMVKANNKPQNSHNKPVKRRCPGESPSKRHQQDSKPSDHMATSHVWNGQREPAHGERPPQVCRNPKVLGATRWKRFSFRSYLVKAEDSESLSNSTPNLPCTASMMSLMWRGLFSLGR